MKKKEYLSLGRLGEQLMLIEDSRRSGGSLQHRLVDILVIVLMAFICGCDSWEEIEDYDRTKEMWLNGFLPLENWIPSADTPIGGCLSASSLQHWSAHIGNGWSRMWVAAFIFFLPALKPTPFSTVELTLGIYS